MKSTTVVGALLWVSALAACGGGASQDSGAELAEGGAADTLSGSDSSSEVLLADASSSDGTVPPADGTLADATLDAAPPPDGVTPRDATPDAAPDAPPADTSAPCTGGALGPTSIDYALPPSFPSGAFTLLTDPGSCATTRQAHTLMDVTGDGLPDMVLTVVCGDAMTGTSRWRVHRGTPTGFAATPVDWALPTGYPAQAFTLPNDPGSCATTHQAHWTLDVTGDRIPDLVLTVVCGDAMTGTSRWLVYPGGASGFATTPINYALPPSFPSGAFTLLTDPGSCATTRQAHTLMDVTGDGLPDMVLTVVCGDAMTGTSRWRVYRGTPTGFAATPVDWALPPGFTAQAFTLPNDPGSCATTRQAHWTLDVTGDRVPDLVLTVVCGDAMTGTSRWLVYPGGASGFATTPIDYALPPSFPSGAFTLLTDPGSCATTRQAHTLMDVTGDGLPDMVLTVVCGDAMTGTSRWRVHRGTPTGFAATALDWTLPTGFPAQAFTLPNDPGSCATTHQAHWTLDVTGDRVPDLVMTVVCGDAMTGTSRWLVYPGRGCP